ncbi:MAG: 50S ribosomal protein L35 [Anaerolineaceae bacterium]|nr:50S ribosomal protein L35 [Anaerolineaceae bacterium]
MGKKYKLKTHKATSKRFRVTGTGKVVRTKGGKSHFRRRTPKRTKRQLHKLIGIASSKQAKKIKQLAPYLSKHRQNPPG